jgi:RNA polymerase-binding transcription factor DksA
MSLKKPTLATIKKQLEQERDRIKKILARRAHKDSHIPGNYITDFPNTGDEVDDTVFENVTYEENLAIEHVLERRLKQIEKDLQDIASGTYQL